MEILMRFFLVLLLALSACSNPAKTTPKQESPSQTWPEKMRKAGATFQDLLPYIYDEEAFGDEKNRKVVEEKISRFADSIHTIDSDKAKQVLGDDPYVLQSLHQLQEFSHRAKEFYSRGDFQHSRILLKATTNACFKCHTRIKYGPESYYWKNFEVSQLKTTPLEKAHILVSMRQYDEAKLYINQHLSDLEKAGNYGIPYENTLHYYLMISLRGQQTIKNSKNYIQSKVSTNRLPQAFGQTVKNWISDLGYWEKHTAELTPTLGSAEHVLKRNKKGEPDQNTVNNLIASSLLHQYLMKPSDPSNKAKAYYMLGNIYDSLILAGFWDLPEVYYEMCIRYAPKSKMSKLCYAKYRDNIVLGYSGSRGTMIPHVEYQRLEKLKAMAGVK